MTASAPAGSAATFARETGPVHHLGGTLCEAGDEGVDDHLHVDSLGLGHIGDGLAGLEFGAQFGLGHAEGLGGDGERVLAAGCIGGGDGVLGDGGSDDARGPGLGAGEAGESEDRRSARDDETRRDGDPRET